MYSQDHCTIDNLINDLYESLDDCKEIYDWSLRARCEKYIRLCLSNLKGVLSSMGEDGE